MQWTSELDDWNHVKLKTDLEWGQDYMLVSSTVWTKLVRFFGAAFEIPIFLADRIILKNKREPPTGVEINSNELPDL